MSTGAKVLIGCGIAAVAFVVLAVVVFGAGAWFLDRHLSEEGAGLRRQAEVTRTLAEMEAEQNFMPPPDGVIGEERAQRFFAATDAAWEDTREWATELQQRVDEAEARGRGTMGDAGFAVRGMGRVRVTLGDALIEHRMPPTEYLWTGQALLHAHARRDQPSDASGVPRENVALARQYDDRLREMARDDEEARMTRGSLFAFASTLILSEDARRRVQQWDTLQHTAR